ncbi:MAG: hypothetical protein RIT04_420 [Candidatus Parcubacteria bacterium]|jgi:phosphohistidine swiveling domain-containing protein
MKKIEKTISRDLPLINMYAWHEGYTKGMKEWLGWSYSDALFYAHDGYVDIMRPPEEHLVDFKKVLLEKINSDRTWFVNEHKKFLELTKEIHAFYDTYERIIDSASTQQMSQFYSSYVNYIFKIVGPFISMIWLPIWLEKDPVLASSYTKEIELAIEARKVSEQIFPRGDLLIIAMLKNMNGVLKWDSVLSLKKILYEECINFFEKGIVPDLAVVEQRNSFIFGNHGITLVENNSIQIKNAFKSLGYEYDIVDYSGVKEIIGSVACKGKVSGIVKIIMSKDKINTISDGDILVASMTTPEYLPAMQKAAAFITDEGGVTCHAAIVARELGKPCIIGTKFATKALKNGDRVEVDAESGIVRIIT